MHETRHRRFAQYAWGVLAYTLVVVVWGAFVRASGSGAGCGRHWPLCNGEVIPPAPAVETLIELSHRVTSALIGLLIVALVWAAFRLYPQGHRVRWGAVLSLVFVVTEGLVGAALVLFRLVADDASLARTLSIALHLNNTFVLVACLALTAWWASGQKAPAGGAAPGVRAVLAALVLGTLVVSTAGAITALGDTLFRPETTGAALDAAFTGASHHLEKLRVYHPLLAVALGVALLAGVPFVQRRSAGAASRLGALVVGLYLLQVALGVWNIFLRAPIPLQLVHLFVADALWVALVLFACQSLATAPARAVAALDASPAA